MKRAWRKLISFCLTLAILLSGIPLMVFPVKVEAAADAEYEIYPLPHSITYEAGTVELGASANVVIESAVDEATRNHLNDILAIKNINGSVSDGMVDGTLNILVGIKGSGGAADNWVNANVNYAGNLFEKTDAYVLSIQDNVIAVLGKDTDAAFYGLSSLKLIFEQLQGSEVRKLKMEDYANGQYRGFIEGYYGLPWSVEDRISLMEFGSRFKMNIYIFAPKDDIYHNKQWNVLYPENKLADIRRMVEAGQAAKCRFAWAIHPFMHNQITASNYDASLQVVKEKFQQLYDVGVRQFVISADDASSSAQVQANLCRDMSQWVKEHEGTYNLVFVPQLYNTATGNWYSYSLSSYYNYFKASGLEDVEIMWTGESVCAPAVQSTFDNFKRYSGKDAFMWLNWPVNDVNKPLRRLVMGPAESCILNTNVTSFKGIVTNPLQEAEASKTSLFAIADYAWNIAEFDAQTSWENSFKYIDEGAPEALHELCKHLTNPSPDGITGMGESVELAPYITAFTNALNSDSDITESGNALIAQFDKIEKAADEFQTNGTNENLKDEMKAWVDCLRYLAQAVKGFVSAALAVEAQDADGAWTNYTNATRAYVASQHCETPILLKDSNGDAVTDENGDVVSTLQAVEAGYMKIMPLAQQLNASTDIKNGVMGLLGKEFGGASSGGTTVTLTPIYEGLGSQYQNYAPSRAVDGDAATYAWLNQNIAKDAYFGVDLGAVYKLDTVTILQGKADGDADVFKNAALEYSVDGTNWTTIGDPYTVKRIEVNLLARGLKARYVRLRSLSAEETWFAIREFQVTTRPADDYVYTNVESLAETDANVNVTGASVGDVGSITLGSGQYIGFELPTIHKTTALTADYTQNENLVFEYSSDGRAWSEVGDSFTEADLKYVRIRNKGTEDVTFNLSGISASYTEEDRAIMAEPEGIAGGEAYKASDNTLETGFQASEGAGSLIWRNDCAMASKLYVLMDPSTVSEAKVSVRLLDGTWIKIGTLSKGLNCYTNMEQCGAFGDVKIEWKENGPTIYEIYKTDAEQTLSQALDGRIAKADEITNPDGRYDETLWQAFVTARDEAKAVAAKTDASDEEIENALVKLAGSANELEARIEARAALDAAISRAEGVAEADGADYTAESWNAFSEAYQAAKAAPVDADAETLSQLASALEEAYDGLQQRNPLQEAKDALTAEINRVKAVAEAGQGNYTDATWTAFQTAYQAAVNASEDADAAALQQLEEDLRKAYDGLEKKTIDPVNPIKPVDPVKPVDPANQEKPATVESAKSELAAVIQKADAISKGGQGTYTAASWDAFLEAYAAAAHAPANASIEELQSLRKNLDAAYANLKRADGTKPIDENPASKLKAGDAVTVETVEYKVLNAEKKTAVAVKADQNAKKLKIADTVTVKGVKCKVVQIKAKAFKGAKKLQKVTIGKYVTKIGKQAFFNCKKLKNVTFRQQKAPKIGGKAFAGISKKVKVKAAKAMKRKQRATLRKNLKRAGIKKSIKL